eukprot:jgi/Psemu1/249675/estExt_Genewise1Plus.C_70045
MQGNDPSSAPVIRRRLQKSQRKRDGLIQFAKDITSQNGEDGIIQKIFNDVLPPLENDGKRDERLRYCVDVGAWDGKHLSNTYSLLQTQSTSRSWKGVLIEADPDRFSELKTLHEPLGNICINTMVSSDSASKDSLVSILRREAPEVPLEFDFLCIDVDGSDYWLLHEVFEHRYRPKVICIESNPTMPNDLIYIPARDDATRHGCSLAALVELAEENNYVLVETTLYNAFFVPKDLYHKYFEVYVPDTSIEALHETTMGTELYQLYDGTLKLWGCKKLLWHRIAMDETRMQMISSSQRNFPFAPANRNGMTDAAIYQTAIDMRAYCEPSSANSVSDKEKCAHSLVERLKSDGFALVQGTGIPGRLCRETLRVTHSFLQDADESVRRSCLSKRDRARRGYSPINTENFACLIGAEGPNDLVRKFRMGPPSSPSSLYHQQGSSLLQENIWPVSYASTEWDETNSRDFQATLENYYDKACCAANEILRAICDGLLLEYPDLAISLESLSSSPTPTESSDDTDTMDQNHRNGLAHNTSILTLLGYRNGSRHKKVHQKKKRTIHPLVAAHTDVGVITVLLYDSGDCAVLQRKSGSSDLSSNDGSDQFEDVVLPSRVENEPVFVVNIADCLSALTGKRLPSTVHRVVPREGIVPRNCLALFVGLKGEQKLNIDGKELSYETWRKNRVAESQSVLNGNKK